LFLFFEKELASICYIFFHQLSFIWIVLNDLLNFFFLSNLFICLPTINEKKWYCCQLIMSFYKWLDGITNHWISFWFNLKSNVVYVIPFFLVLSVYVIHGYLTTFFGIFVDFLCKSKDVIWSNQMNARRKLLDHGLCLISSCIVWVADVRFISFSNDFSIWICY
jgi:hypothetical protein